MDLERDNQRLNALDRTAEELSKSIHQFRQETKKIVGFSNDLELKYTEQIEASQALLVHFELCESRANDARHRSSGANSGLEDTTKSHLLVKQVLNSYQSWIGRSHDRRKRHAKAVAECRQKIDAAVAGLQGCVWANGGAAATAARVAGGRGQVDILGNGEKVESEAKDDSTDGSHFGGDRAPSALNGKAVHVLEKQLTEKTMEASHWKSMCESLRADLERMRGVIDNANKEKSFSETAKINQAKKEAREWKSKCTDIQQEVWELRDKLKKMTANVQLQSNSTARVTILQAENEALRSDAETFKSTAKDLVPRSDLSRAKVALDQAQNEKDRLALELVQVMGERDCLKQENERAQWNSEQEGEKAIMQIQAQLQAARNRSEQFKKEQERHERAATDAVTAKAAAEEALRKEQHRYVLLEMDKTNFIELSKLKQKEMKEKLNEAVEQLKDRCARRWSSIFTARAIRRWREGVMERKHRRERGSLCENIVAGYQALKVKRMYIKWSRGVKRRVYARCIMKGMMIRTSLRATFFAFVRWNRKTIAARQAEFLMRSRTATALAFMRKSEHSALQHSFARWDTRVRRTVLVRRTLRKILLPTIRRLLVSGWNKWVWYRDEIVLLEESARRNEFFANLMFAKIRHLSIRRHLNAWHRHSTWLVRTRQVVFTHLSLRDRQKKYVAMNLWKRHSRTRRRKRKLLQMLVFRKLFASLRRSFKIWTINSGHAFHTRRRQRSLQQMAEKMYEVRQVMASKRVLTEWHKAARISVLQKRRIVNILNGGFFTRTTRAALHQWKLTILTWKIAEERSDHSSRLVENKLSAHRRLSLRNCLRRWRLYSNESYRKSQGLRNILVRKKLVLVRKNFLCWVHFRKSRMYARSLLTSMQNVVFRHGIYKGFRKWYVVVEELKLNDAKCLGFGALRKTKYDMARRLFSKARRLKLECAVRKWKEETEAEAKQEEHMAAIAAMSNWAARIAGGRVIKERFQVWFAYTKLRLAKKYHQYSIMTSIINKWTNQLMSFAFRTWDRQVRNEIYHEFEAEVATKRLELESIITSQNNAQLSHRFKALENVSFIMMEKTTKRVLLRTFSAWKCWKISSVAGREKAQQEEESERKRRHSIMIASNALFQKHDKYFLAQTFNAWKAWLTNYEKKKAVVRSILIRTIFTLPVAKAFGRWVLTINNDKAAARHSLMGEKHSDEISKLEEQLLESKKLFEDHKQEVAESVTMLVGGWCHRDDKALLSIFFNRWVRHFLKKKASFEVEEFSPPPIPEDGKIPSGGASARGGLVSYTKTLERENAKLKQRLEASIRASPSQDGSGKPANNAGGVNASGPFEVPAGGLTLRDLAEKPSFHIEEDVLLLQQQNSSLQMELTATQKKLFKAKEKIREVRQGTKDKQKISLLQESLAALEKKHNALVAQLSSTQSDLQEAYRRAEKLEKDVRHHRTMSQNFQKKSDIDRTRVHQFESRLKRETEANASMKQLILRLKKEVQRVMKLHRKAEAELERTCAEEELLKQSVLDEQKTAQVLAQKLQLSAKEVHRLLNENEDLLDRAETKKEPGFDSVPSLLQMDGLAGEISSLPLRPEELAAAIPPPPPPPLPDSYEETEVPPGTPTSAFKKSLAAQVSHIFSDEAEVHITRDSRGYARSPERVAKRNGEVDGVKSGGTDEATDEQVASDVMLAGGLVSMVATDDGEVVATFNVNEGDAQNGSPRGVWR